MAYLGSKTASGAYQAIISQMPAHDVYIETHAGSGAVFFNKPAAPLGSILIERDPEQLKILRLEAFAQGRNDVEATRSSNKRYKFDYTDDDHRALIGFLKALPSNVAVILSGYPSALYDELLSDWRTVEFQVMTRGGPRTEKLWLNFVADGAHWATFAGRDYIDRQRIKRKVATWSRHYARLPAGERLAILSALIGQHSRDPT